MFFKHLCAHVRGGLFVASFCMQPFLVVGIRNPEFQRNHFSTKRRETMKKHLLQIALAAASFSLAGQAAAAPVTYIAADDNVSTLAGMVNSTAAAANFLSVAGALNTVDFESALPANLTITGGNTVSSGCGAVCGFNTTSGGAFYREVFGGSVTFTFTNPVDAFGFYVNGLQTNLVPQQTIVYVDGSSTTQTINMPSAVNGGGAFIGFIDFGQLISSVTFNATNDILGFDDLRFGRSANNPGNPVPEPAGLALFGIGLIGLIAAQRRRTAKR
jgi:hypothetical protein